MNTFRNFVTGAKSAWITLLIGLGFLFLAVGPLNIESDDTTPGAGLPDTAESIQVQQYLDQLPSSDGTAVVILYRTTDGSQFSESQLNWLQGEFDAGSMMPAGGANEKFLDFSSVEVAGEPFVPPATISDDSSAATIVVALAATEIFDETDQRIIDLRALASVGLPTGLQAYVTGPEAFVADVGNIFAGADFTLLLASVGVVALILLVTYRSPVLLWVPLIVVATTDFMAQIVAARIAEAFGFVPDASVTGILAVLVFGAGTNYALLLIARYKEELLTQTDRRVAMRNAVRGAGPAILASGGTVAVALLLLLFAEIEGRQVLGLVGAIGVIMAMFAGLVILPAALVIFGRGLFWPFIPRVGGKNPYDNGIFAKIGKAVFKRPIAYSGVAVVFLVLLSTGGLNTKTGLSGTEIFIDKPEAVVGQEFLAEAFPAGSSTPTSVIIENSYLDQATEIIANVGNVEEVSVGGSTELFSQLSVVLDAEAQSALALETVADIRTALDALPDEAIALVGGQDAVSLDEKDATSRDEALLVPLILISVFLILVLLLRSLVTPVLLLLAVVLSFFAAFGASWLIFVNIMGFPALDLTVFILAFLFLVALGVDYSIFLVTRAQEEARKLGTAQGMLKALGATGGVITSAGVLLAAVFSVLGVLPLIALAQVGTIVGIGVLLDTLLVRTVIVPALAFTLKEKFWWPRKDLGVKPEALSRQ